MTAQPTPEDLEALLLAHLPASKHYLPSVKAKIVAAMQAALAAQAPQHDVQEPATTEHQADAPDAPDVSKRRAKYLLNDTDAGRAYVAQFFRVIGRHDFDDYIQTELAGDFACVLASALATTTAVRAACGKIIQTLAEIVRAPQTDAQLDAGVVPRDPLMHRVQDIKAQVDAIYKLHPVNRAAPQQEVHEPVRTSGRNCYLCGHPAEAHPMGPNPRGGMRRGNCPTTTAQPTPSGDAEDAARWRMAVLIGNEVMMHPEKRTHAVAVKAYMDATGNGSDLTGAVDAARAAQKEGS